MLTGNDIRNIVVIGLGYVGLANAILLAKKYNVTGLDIIDQKIQDLRSRKSPLDDKEIIEHLRATKARWHNVTSAEADTAIAEANMIIISTPTDYDDATNQFNTELVESAIENAMARNSATTFLIKSTIPVGYVSSIRERYNNKNIIFSPEFLREGHALHDSLNPSRIIVGEKSDRAERIASVFASCALNDPPILLTDANEAEAIKLFANTYLSMRVAYINELDTYCRIKGMDAKDVIVGMGLDPRIGTHYCNPSFGYGGYCLPKDAKQLKANFTNVPHDIISSIIASNKTRKQFMADQIMSQNPKSVGIYRLTMKSGSDNFRYAAILDILEILRDRGVELTIFEPTTASDTYNGIRIERDIIAFKEQSDIVVANRPSSELDDVTDRVFTPDVFGRDI